MLRQQLDELREELTSKLTAANEEVEDTELSIFWLTYRGFNQSSSIEKNTETYHTFCLKSWVPEFMLWPSPLYGAAVDQLVLQPSVNHRVSVSCCYGHQSLVIAPSNMCSCPNNIFLKENNSMSSMSKSKMKKWMKASEQLLNGEGVLSSVNFVCFVCNEFLNHNSLFYLLVKVREMCLNPEFFNNMTDLNNE